MQFDRRGPIRHPLGTKAPPSPKSRSLSATAVNDLIEAGQTPGHQSAVALGAIATAAMAWEAEVAKTAGKRFPARSMPIKRAGGSDDQTRKNDLRHSKFGGSLTRRRKSGIREDPMIRIWTRCHQDKP